MLVRGSSTEVATAKVGTLGHPEDGGGGGVVLVDSHPVGYWIDSTTQRGYPELNGIFTRQKNDKELSYEHTESAAILKWVPQGWLLHLASGTQCFLQMSVTQLMVNSRGWMAIDDQDADPLAEPPDEVVALLDDGALADLIAAKHLHDEAIRRSQLPLLPPSIQSTPGGTWWRVLHIPAVIVRAAPSLDARRAGHKLTGERVFGLEMRGAWLRVHEPCEGVDVGWMLTDATGIATGIGSDERVRGMGVLMSRCIHALPPSRAVVDDIEADWEHLAAAAPAEHLADAAPANMQAHSPRPPGGAASSQRTTVGARLRAKKSVEERTVPPPPSFEEATVPTAGTHSFSPATSSATSIDDPVEATRCKLLGDAAFRHLQFELADARYTEALAAAGGADAAQRSVIHCNRSAARRQLRNLPGALDDATAALDISPTYRKAAFRHAMCLLETESYPQALAAFTQLRRLDPAFPNLVAWLQRCHVRIERCADGDPNHYTLLNAPCDASDAMLKHAYRRQSKRLHPDRAHDASAVNAATGAFQAMQRAYDVLRDPQTRREYDFGPKGDWELVCRARHWPPARFRPFKARAQPTAGQGLWDPTW